MTKIQTVKPVVRQRFAFIEFQLAWEGAVGRKKLQDQFAISPPQATKDLTAYSNICPNNIVYDPRRRSYIPGPGFYPEFTHGKPDEFLQELDLVARGYKSKEEIWPTQIPPFEILVAQARKISADTLSSILKALHAGHAIQAIYTSLTTSPVEQRTLIPRALASDGQRWHLRAFHLEKDRYSDFVLSRLRDVFVVKAPEIDIPDDDDWNEYVTVVLRADPMLPDKGRLAIEHEYDMRAGQLEIASRRAMLFYVLRQHGFDPRPDGNIHGRSSFMLTLQNPEEVEKCLYRR